MTNFTKKLMLAMAACTIAAGTAAAQTYTAQIPFAFRAGKTVMAPGSYQINVSGLAGAKSVSLYNREAGKGVMLIPSAITGNAKDQDALKVRFECAGPRCSLASLGVGGWVGAYVFPKPHLGPAEMARVVEIDLTRAKAD